MKCVCGYEHEEGFDSEGEWHENLIGDKPFYIIYPDILTNRKGEKIILKACPKCGTVKATNQFDY